MIVDRSGRIAANVSTLTLLLAFCFTLPLIFSSLSYAQGIDNDPHATGLIMLTPEENELFVETHPLIVDVLPNSKGIERANRERAARGLPPLPVPWENTQGEDLILAVGGKPVKNNAASKTDYSAESLSLQVDNSEAAWFPPIRTQGSLGSCAAFACTYYQLTYTIGDMWNDNGELWDAKNDPLDEKKFSPRWTYNFARESNNNGSPFWDNFNVLEGHGAATWAEFPYDGEDYRQWYLDTAETSVWQNAIRYRIDPIKIVSQIGIVDDQSNDIGLEQIKQLLNNGYILTFGTFVSSWQFASVKNDRSTSEDDAFVGEDIAYWVNGELGGHGMTVVGYNDHIWVDINKDKKVQSGEKGALKIANSWGANWGNNGFVWLAYDALRAVSNIGPNSSERKPAFDYNIACLMTAKEYNYTPKLLAEFEIAHAKRNQLRLHLEVREPDGQAPILTWYPGVFNLHGGPYNFNGEEAAAVSGRFLMDFTDILQEDTMDYCLGIYDSTPGDPIELLSFRLRDTSDTDLEQFPKFEIPSIFDDMVQYCFPISYDFGGTTPTTPKAVIALANGSSSSGNVPLTVVFDGSGSTGAIDRYVWNFGDGGRHGGAETTVPTVEYTYENPGIFNAKLTVIDETEGISSDSMIITVTQDESQLMYVSSIEMGITSTNPVFTSAFATVTVWDLDQQPVPNVKVTGKWSGKTSDSEMGYTEETGENIGTVTFYSDNVKKPRNGDVFTFTISFIEKDGWMYDEENPDNVASASIIYPQASPALIVATSTALLNAYPSPGNPEIWIPFTLSQSEHVIIRIYDAAGRLVRTLDLGNRVPGVYMDKEKAAHWDGRNEAGEAITSGIYFYLMQAGDFTATKKLMITK